MSRQLATFTLGGARYGVDVLVVQEALRFHARTPVPLAPTGVAGLVNLRGEVVLTVDLRHYLGLPALADGDQPMMVVVQVEGEGQTAADLGRSGGGDGRVSAHGQLRCDG